ncbi:MAG: hypothetical protein M3Y60_08280 [Bacteroidota bacterium]|nr:hypothetical protein [Bacteroidota bacterium]
MEREKFEESWKKAFEGAEVSPSRKVWTNIELDLEKARGGELKRRLMFYQMLAAASVVFALAVSGIGYYSYNAGRASEDLLALEAGRAKEAAPDQSTPEVSAEQITSANQEPSANLEVPRNSEASTRAVTGAEDASQADNIATVETNPYDATPSRTDPSQVPGTLSSELVSLVQRDQRDQIVAASAHPATRAAYPDALPSQIEDRRLAPLYEPSEIRLNFNEHQDAQVDPVVAMMAKLEQREREMQSEEEKKKERDSESEKLWTSIGFAAGAFNTVQASAPGPSFSNGSAFAMAANAAPIVDQETKATGYSYTMGINIGTRIAERWVLQGGVNYLTNSSEYMANNVIMEPAGKFAEHRYRAVSTNDLINSDEHDLNNKLVYTAPYSVNNSMRYLSIPLQAGYLLVDKTFGLQLNAGVATDLFLQNTVQGEGDQLAKTSQPLGSDSPYRTVNLSGLLGTEFSYRFGPHYRVSLNPGIRYPFNTIYKSELGVDSTPLTFDVGLRFRYIFH